MATKIDIKANVQSEDKGFDTNVGEKSLKSLRTYQVGVVYRDKYGRETPVLTNETASFTVPKMLSDKRNSISASVRNEAPDWAHSYKFFVKETSNEYYNVCMDRWYDAEDGNIWLSLPSAERNKIQDDTFILLKKKASSQDAVYEEGRYRIIDIENEAPTFIKTDYDKYGEDTLVVLNGSLKPDATTTTFQFAGGSHDWDDSVFYDSTMANAGASNATSTGFIGWPLDNVVIRIGKESGGMRTDWLDVANIYGDATAELTVRFSKALEGSGSGGTGEGVVQKIQPSGSGNVNVTFARRVVKDKSEFEGRFFIKIRRDGPIEEHVRSVGNTAPSFNIQESINYYWCARARPISNSATPDDSYWQSIGEKWMLDDADRSAVGDGWGAGSGGPWHEDSGYGLIGDNFGGNGGWFSPFTSGCQQGARGAPWNSDSDSSLRCTMELTIQKILDNSKKGYDFSNNSSNYQTFADKITTHGTMFRFAEDPWKHIYKIYAPSKNSLVNSTNGSGIINYDAGDRERDHNKCGRMYLRFRYTGFRVATEGGEDYLPIDTENEGKWAFAYVPSGEGFIPEDDSLGNKWEPRMKGYGNYTNVTATHVISSNAGYIDNQASGWNNSSSNNVRHNTIQIIETESGGDTFPEYTPNPAIWETEPKEDVGLDIYYEASQAYPLTLENSTNELFAPYGCVVTCDDSKIMSNGDEYKIYLPPNTKLVDWEPTGHGGDTILLSIPYDKIGYQMRDALPSTSSSQQFDLNAITTIKQGTSTTLNTGIATVASSSIYADMNQSDWLGLELKFTRLDGSYTTAKVTYISAWSNTDNFQGVGSIPNMSGRVLIKLDRDLNGMNVKLPYFNCFSFGNGVESDRIRDDFNAVRLDKGVKASTVLETPYEEEQRSSGLIYSGIYNSNSGINNLNQFIAGEKITKDAQPSYGSIQKLKARDTNLVAFCEDKVLKIQAYKDALYKADGNPDIISTNKVLGDITTFAGEFGISKNPESFAEDSFRMYFADKQRGKVLRLSQDGITSISDMGMKDYFADNLKLYNTLIGSFDDKKQEYNLTMVNNPVEPSSKSGYVGGTVNPGSGGGGGLNTGAGSTAGAGSVAGAGSTSGTGGTSGTGIYNP